MGINPTRFLAHSTSTFEVENCQARQSKYVNCFRMIYRCALADIQSVVDLGRDLASGIISNCQIYEPNWYNAVRIEPCLGGVFLRKNGVDDLKQKIGRTM